MKTIMLVLLILCGQIIFSQVDTRLVYVSNSRDIPLAGLSTLVIDVEAISNSGTSQINVFQDAIQLDANFIAQNPSIVFSNQLFPPSNYTVTEDYNSTTFPGRLRYIYTYSSGTKGTINSTYTRILTISIQYTTGSSTGSINWTTLAPNYLVNDGNNNPITGIELSVPSELSAIPLPVELSSFTASSNQNVVNLKWQTTTEVNNYGFEIERASSSTMPLQVWEKIGFVNGNGNSNSPKTYSFNDYNPSGGSKFLYRLKQIDNDGQFEYSYAVEVEIVPKEFALYQNYPNPFNPTTKINYCVPFDSRVAIYIYSITGELVSELVNDNIETGTYSIDFNGSNLASGMYIYKMAAGSFVKTYKMMLMK